MVAALITGGSGFVGSHLTDHLLANTDWDIHIFLRWQDSLDNLPIHRINQKNRVFLHYGDLNDAFSIQKALEEKPDYIFHLAAQSYPKTSFDSPIETLQTNIIGTANLLEVVRQKTPMAKVHICASSEVFGRVPQEKTPISEECSFHPASPYAISKVGTDLLGRFYAEAYGMNVQVTRMGTHTGPRRSDVFHESSFAKQIAMIEQNYQEPVIYHGNLDSLRTYADVRDAVRAYHLLLTHNPIPGAYYNIAGDYVCKVGDTIKYLLSLSNREIEPRPDPNRFRPIDADLQVFDTTKFRNHCGWKPEIKFETTMQDLLNYWRDKIKKHGPSVNR